MADIRIELSPVIDLSGQITFYVDLPNGRELGFLRPGQPEHATARAAIEACEKSPHKPMTTAGPMPPTISLQEERVRALITESHTWGTFAALKRS